ncbi:LysM peptidoglycan-binding domain-containing protein [Candidatus Entotheonella palauensis]|uniref:LysM peptidoglycan-binding domain-containing protein n=1 Tax=Candidatus Entotheonella palauensis TaxID=93172 RepID=UPI0015C43ED1|nr:LysM peptidoglycan-binding domain-containing protein [Candidatus Entotheonella palauensis]
MPMLRFGLIHVALVIFIFMLQLTYPSWSPPAYGQEMPIESERSWMLGEKQKQVDAAVSIRERGGFIARDETFLGTIYYAMGEAHLLHTGDLALIDIGSEKGLQVGEYLTIFGVSPMVRHTQTGALMGRPVRMLGTAILVQVEATTATIRITEVFDEILVGDRVERYGVLPPEVPTVEPSVQAVMRTDTESAFGSIQSTKDNKLALAAGDIVYIDQGAAQGVKMGDRFLVYNERRTARHPDTDIVLPVAPRPIGELRIVDVQIDSSTAHVEMSRLEFGVGAMVRLADHRARSAYSLAGVSTVDALLVLIPPCLEQARAAIRAARAAGVRTADLLEAANAIIYATTTFEQAQALLEQGNREQAHQLLQAVESDCLRAQQLAGDVNWQLAAQSGDRYTVQPGDSLWGIAARPAIYQDPLLWPILYQGNRDRLSDPDMIYPQQELAVPRGYSQDDANTARQRARTRGPWRLGDGSDDYILEGFQP